MWTVEEVAYAYIKNNVQFAGSVIQSTSACITNEEQDVLIVGDRNVASMVKYDQIVRFVKEGVSATITEYDQSA